MEILMRLLLPEIRCNIAKTLLAIISFTYLNVLCRVAMIWKFFLLMQI